MSTPVKAPAQAPASVAQTATPKKVCDTAAPTMQRASATGPPTRKGRRPHRSDPAPATSEETPQATEVIAIRLATSGRLVPKVAGHVDEEGRARRAAGGGGEHAEAGGRQQRPGHAGRRRGRGGDGGGRGG